MLFGPSILAGTDPKRWFFHPPDHPLTQYVSLHLTYSSAQLRRETYFFSFMNSLLIMASVLIFNKLTALALLFSLTFYKKVSCTNDSLSLNMLILLIRLVLTAIIASLFPLSHILVLPSKCLKTMSILVIHCTRPILCIRR